MLFFRESLFNPMEEINNHQLDVGKLNECISTLEYLLKNTHELWSLPKEKRIGLMKLTGLLSRLNQDKARP